MDDAALSNAPFRDARYAPRALNIERRADGSLMLANPTPFGTGFTTTLDALVHWAAAAPERVWLAERAGEGWRTVDYATALTQVSALAGGLKGLGLKRGDCLLILARNTVDHALICYAAMALGVAVAPVSPQYGLAGADLSRLAYACGVLSPDAVYADDAAAFAGAETLTQRARTLVLEGVTSVEEAVRVTRQETAEAHEALAPGDAIAVPGGREDAA